MLSQFWAGEMLLLCIVAANLVLSVEAVKYDWFGSECQAIKEQRQRVVEYEQQQQAAQSSSATCLSGCVQEGSLSKFERCLTHAQCNQTQGNGEYVFCSTKWRICKSNSDSVDWSKISYYDLALCDSCPDSKDLNKCTGCHEDFPNNWVKCTDGNGMDNCDTSRLVTPPPPTPAPSYSRSTYSGTDILNEDDEFAKYAICYHNKFRQEAGLKPVEWDRELSSFANYWAQELKENKVCGMEHSPDSERINTTKWWRIGENLAIQYQYYGIWDPNTAPEYGAYGTEAWYDEMYYYQWGTYGSAYCPTRKKNNAVVGHMTALMWHATTHIGCDYQVCEYPKAPSWKPNTPVDFWQIIISCNYGPGGNIVGTKPFFKENICKINKNPETIEKYGEVTNCEGNKINCDEFN